MRPGLLRRLSRTPSGLVLYTRDVAPATFDPSWTFAAGGGPMTVDYGDGTAKVSHATGVSYAYPGAGTKLVRITAPDLAKITAFDSNSDVLVGPCPPFRNCINLRTIYLDTNQLSGVCPPFANNTLLTDWRLRSNLFSGSIPTFAPCTLLQIWYGFDNAFSGTLPSFATCTALTDFRAQTNQLTDYTAGGFATQKSLAILNLSGNLLPASAVNAILADCVTSIGGAAHVACTLSLQAGNAAPTGQGITDRGTLVTAGWTVTTS